MASTQEIIDAARHLGKLIAQHPAATKMEAVLNAIEDDREAQRALTDFNRHMETVAEKQQKGQPIEVEDKRKLEELQKAVVRNKALRDMQVAQMDYADLMRQVDEAMSDAMPDAPERGAGAGPALTG